MQIKLNDCFLVGDAVHWAKAVKYNRKTGQRFLVDEANNMYDETACQPFFTGFDPSQAEQPLSDQELQTCLLIAQAIIDSNDPTDLALLATLNNTQKRQLADCLTVEQKIALTALKRANQAA